ncbi:glycosyltransferase family 4 protein [Candidatus Woesearchaeota archaeon]|nr:glycosyltransferase family 4 protein [Candidatus Woesearchaeota archaeon]
MKKTRIASVIPPHVTTQSFVNLSKVYSYISKKYNAEITVFADDKLDYKPKSLKTRRVFGIDGHFGLYKILFFLGLPRFYYPRLVEELDGFDVIESSTPEFYIYALQAYHAAKRYKSRLVLRTSQTTYDFFLFPYTKFIALYFAIKACRFASCLCFTHPESRDAYKKMGLIKGDAGKKIRIIGHGVDTKIFRPLNLKKDGKKTILLSVAAMIKVKGHQNIIKAAKILADKNHKNIELWIVGDGNYKKELEELAENLGIANHVKFLGALPHSRLVEIYNRAHIFVFSNLTDVTPAVSEAMLCSLPVVAARCSGLAFVIPSGKHGIITKHNDAEDLARGIEKLMADKMLQNKLAKNARKYILENFSIEKVGDKLYRAYIGK